MRRGPHALPRYPWRRERRDAAADYSVASASVVGLRLLLNTGVSPTGVARIRWISENVWHDPLSFVAAPSEFGRTWPVLAQNWLEFVWLARRLPWARYAGLGMPFTDVGRIVSLGPAPDQHEARAVLASKFRPPPPHELDALCLRPPPPPADTIGEGDTLQAIEHFAHGAGAGPSEIRPDVLRRLVERNPSSDIAKTMSAFEQVLPNGEAPIALAPCIAGAAGRALKQRARSRAGQACAGKAWMRAVGNALLRIDADALHEHLLPVFGGVDVLPHLARASRAEHAEDVASRSRTTPPTGSLSCSARRP